MTEKMVPSAEALPEVLEPFVADAARSSTHG